MLSQIIRLTLPSTTVISSNAFVKLRRDCATAGASSQYFGYSMQTRPAPIPKKRHEILWVIQWPDGVDLTQRPELLDALIQLSQGNTTHALIDLGDNDHDKLLSALNSPVCEIVAMRLAANAPFNDDAFRASTHKTYTDCYEMQGFVGGDRCYCINTNTYAGKPIAPTGDERLDNGHQRLAIYYLGWESIELHEDASKTEIFAEEMDKLGP